MTTEKANLSGTQTQITAYVYGTGTPYGSSPVVYRDDLVSAVVSGLTSSTQLAGLVQDIERWADLHGRPESGRISSMTGRARLSK